MLALAVFIGGGVGSVCRYLLGYLVQSRFHSAFPLGTLIVNVLGCIAIGLLAKYFAQGQPESILQVALITGFCGGFTTFSAFSFEAFALWNGGRPLAALGYVAGSLALCLSGTAVGYLLGPQR